MHLEIRWKTGLDPGLVDVTRDRLTTGLARVAHRLGRVVLWREMRAETGRTTAHWVVRVEIAGGPDLVISTPDPGDDVEAAAHAGERVARAVQRNLAVRDNR